MTQPEFVIANKVKFDREQALSLLEGVKTVRVAKGKKHLQFELGGHDEQMLTKAILGPSGTLRAPAMRVGETFIVGYHAEVYEEIFG